MAAPEHDPQSDEHPAGRAARRREERRPATPTGRSRRGRRGLLWLAAAALVVAVTAVGVSIWSGLPRDVPLLGLDATASATPSTAAAPTFTAATTAGPQGEPGTASPSAEPSQSPTSTAAVIDYQTVDALTVLVNKTVPLPSDYVPADLVPVSELGVPSLNGHSLRSEAAYAVQALFADAATAGFQLDMTSGYRSYESQRGLYDGYVADLGQEAADLTSARPGHSEHQTGLAADISDLNDGCVLEGCFGETPAGQWLAQNAWRHGFILRYPAEGTAITGYEYEPWHFRYVGAEIATAMHERGISTYEEFLGLTGA